MPSDRTPHRPVSLAEAARLRGVSRAAVTKACREGGLLAPAKLPSGKLDANHAAFLAWVAGGAKPKPHEPAHEARSAGHGDRSEQQPASLSPKPRFRGPQDVTELLQWTFQALVDRFGSDTGFGVWLDDRRKLADIHRIEVATDLKLGRLVERELVEQTAFAYLETLSIRLLRDASKTIASRARGMSEAGQPLEEIEAMARDLLSKSIEDTKHEIARALGASPTNEMEEDDEDQPT